MFRNDATLTATYAATQRDETAARTTPIATNGNRYRSWTRVGRTKNARARTASPTRIVRLSGLRATTYVTRGTAGRGATAPTTPGGTPKPAAPAGSWPAPQGAGPAPGRVTGPSAPQPHVPFVTPPVLPP